MVTQTWLEAAAYPNQADAQAAVDELKSKGFDENLISIVYTDAGHSCLHHNQIVHWSPFR